jgi:hypothetical protein
MITRHRWWAVLELMTQLRGGLDVAGVGEALSRGPTADVIGQHTPCPAHRHPGQGGAHVDELADGRASI